MASSDAMVARLACSLAIAEGKRPVDLRPSKGLRQPKVFMLGKLLTAREYTRRSFLGMFRSAWRINGTMRVEEAGENDCVLISFSNSMDRTRVWKGGPWGFNRAPIALAEYDGVSPVMSVPLQQSSYWMTLMGVPPAFRSERIMRLIRSTLGEFMEFDRVAFRTRVLRIWVKIDYARTLLLKRRFWVEDVVQFMVHFKYDKMFGQCGRCGLVMHIRLPCSGLELLEEDEGAVGMVELPSALAVLHGEQETSATAARVQPHGPTLVFKAQVPWSISEAFLPQTLVHMGRVQRQVQIRDMGESRQEVPLITGLRRPHDSDGVIISPKKLRLSLAVGKKNLDAVTMGIIEAAPSTNDQPKRKCGRPVGSLNKMPYGTVGKNKTVKKDEEQKKTPKNSMKTNLLPRLSAAEDGANSDPKGKELALF